MGRRKHIHFIPLSDSEKEVREAEQIRIKELVESNSIDFDSFIKLDICKLYDITEAEEAELQSHYGIFCILNFMETAWNTKTKIGLKYAKIQQVINPIKNAIINLHIYVLLGDNA